MKMLFELGQEIVCIDDSSKYGVKMPVKNGSHYFVKGHHLCGCGVVGLDVGFSGNNEMMMCTTCYTRHKTNTWFLRQERFAPVDHIENVNELINELHYESLHIC